MSFWDSKTLISEKLKASMAVEEFLLDNPSIIEIQTYIQMARNDLESNPYDIYAQEIINLLSGT